MQIKKHLNGGTLRTVMAEEIKRCIVKYANDDQPVEKAAMELGIAPRTLRVWKGDVSQGGWEELQGRGGMELLCKTPKKSKSKKKAKKKVVKSSELRA